MPQLSHLKTRDGIWLGFGRFAQVILTSDGFLLGPRAAQSSSSQNPRRFEPGTNQQAVCVSAG